MSTIRVELRKDGDVTKAFTGEYDIWGYVSRIVVGSDVYTYTSNSQLSNSLCPSHTGDLSRQFAK